MDNFVDSQQTLWTLKLRDRSFSYPQSYPQSIVDNSVSGKIRILNRSVIAALKDSKT